MTRAARSSRVLPALGEVVRAFKAVSTYHIRAACMPGFAWQRNYYDHIIRTDADLHRIRACIDANPANRAQDEENPGA